MIFTDVLRQGMLGVDNLPAEFTTVFVLVMFGVAVFVSHFFSWIGIVTQATEPGFHPIALVMTHHHHRIYINICLGFISQNV